MRATTILLVCSWDATTTTAPRLLRPPLDASPPSTPFPAFVASLSGASSHHYYYYYYYYYIKKPAFPYDGRGQQWKMMPLSRESYDAIGGEQNYDAQKPSMEKAT